MASIAFTFINSREGMQAVSFNIEDKDFGRIYSAYKAHYMVSDQKDLDRDNPNDDKHDYERVLEGDYNMKSVFGRLASELMYSIIGMTNKMEVNEAMKGLNIQYIQIKD